MNNEECKVRPQIVNVNSKEPFFCRFSIKTSKCSGSCNNINDPYANLCVPDVIKNLNSKTFNLMSRTNETRHIIYRKEFIKNLYNKGFIWNPSNCECECDESCDIGEFLDYQKCKCRKKLVDKLVEECTETNNEVNLAKITLAENENKYKCSSCTLYIVLFSINFYN